MKKKIILALLSLTLMVPMEACQKKKTSPVLYQLTPSNDTLCMSYVIKTKNNKIIVIDGGGIEYPGYLYSKLQEISGSETPVVETWFLTHMHTDHVNEFINDINNEKKPITVKKVYYNFPSRNYMQKKEAGEYYYLYDQLQAACDIVNGEGSFVNSNAKNIFEGDKLSIDGIDIDVIMAVTDEETIEKDINDTSLILRLNIEGQSVLFLADANIREGDRLLAKYGSELKSDIVQMAHHGQNGVTEAVYQAIQPTMCLWPCPDWVYNNTNGNLKTLFVRRWMYDLGVKHHMVTGVDGSQSLEFPVNFEDLNDFNINPDFLY